MTSKTKKRLLYSLVFLLVIAAGAAFYIYKEYNRRNKDTSLIKSAFSLPASELVSDFEKNDSLAGKKYIGEVIEVSGKVKEVAKDEKNYITVVLGESSYTTSIRCSIDSTHNMEFSQLHEGDSTAIKGICSGFNKDELLGSDVVLVRCVLANNKK